MALTSGFFNSVSGDRTYNADQLSSMFEGLISDGIYESVGDAFQVTADTGMNVLVGTGRAMVNSKWVKNTAPITVEINEAHVLLNRYTAVVLRLDISNREITVETIDGTAASTPSKPAIVRSSSYYDLLLAYIYVGAGVTSITQANIEDQRANTTYCGWVTGVVTQVDTSTLFLQWQNAYETFYNQMLAWMTSEQSAFDAWFAALTDELNINTFIEEYIKTASIAYGASKVVSLDMTGYTYENGDIFIVSINGLEAKQGTDYTVSTSGATPTVTFLFTGVSGQSEDVKIRVLKSKIGSADIG